MIRIWNFVVGKYFFNESKLINFYKKNACQQSDGGMLNFSGIISCGNVLNSVRREYGRTQFAGYLKNSKVQLCLGGRVLVNKIKARYFCR